jgi:hypothetical protein
VEIAQEIGSTPALVSRTATRLGLVLHGRANFLGTWAPADVVEAFAAKAKGAQVRPSIYLRRILQTIARDDLFDAVLDGDAISEQQPHAS